MARLRASWRTSLPVVQQPRNPQSESIARSPYEVWVRVADGRRPLPLDAPALRSLSSRRTPPPSTLNAIKAHLSQDQPPPGRFFFIRGTARAFSSADWVSMV